MQKANISIYTDRRRPSNVVLPMCHSRRAVTSPRHFSDEVDNRRSPCRREPEFGSAAHSRCYFPAAFGAAGPGAQADRPAASYYYREMYLPQLTTGPSAVAWAPDSSSLVYSMAGSLWRQKLDSTVAEQLTAGPGYDYQPDCSPDGRWVVYASYAKDAVELWALNLETRQYAAAHAGRRGQRRATFFTRWQAGRFRFHIVQRAFSHFCRGNFAMANLPTCNA